MAETTPVTGKDNYSIHLNFLPVETDGVRFVVHRRKCSSAQEPRPRPEANAHKLPAGSPDEEKWSAYWVLMEPVDGFEPFEFQAEWNADLARKILFTSLKKSAMARLKPAEYQLPTNVFIDEVSFVIHTHPEGQEELVVQPYSLRATRQSGFLVDFHFRLGKGVTFSRRIQQLSLSLDRNFRRNADYCIDRSSKIRQFLESDGPYLKA